MIALRRFVQNLVKRDNDMTDSTRIRRMYYMRTGVACRD